MIVEGTKVTYAGIADPFVEIGTPAKVLALSGVAAHVQWLGGAKQGGIDLVDLNDLVPFRADYATGPVGVTASREFDEALDMPATPVLRVRATYDDTGEEGLVTALAESGHLALCSEYVDEAVGLIATRIRHDPNFSAVLGALEADEAEGLVGKVAAIALTYRLSEEG